MSNTGSEHGGAAHFEGGAADQSQLSEIDAMEREFREF